MAKDRPNFFALLGLDPHAPWDQALFVRVLAKRRSEWSTAAQNGFPRKKAQDAKYHLTLFAEIKEVMSSADRRREERELAIRHERAALEDRRREVGGRLSLMLAKGYLLVEEATGLRAEFADVLAADPALADRVERAEKRSSGGGTASARLPPEDESRLSGQLAEVGEISLYELLRGVDESITNTSPLPQLRQAAQELWTRTHLIKDKSDPTLPTRERLGVFAKSVFASEEKRAQHDMSMKAVTLQAIIKRFETTLKLAASVSARQFELYLEEARLGGVDDLVLAKREFVAHFGKLGWAVELPAAESERQLRSRVQCPRCADLNDETSTACKTCGLLLREPCPRCGAVDPAYGLGCRRCGFPIGQRYLVEELITEAKSALRERDLEQARLSIDRAARIWAVPADRPDPLAREIREFKGSVDTTLLSISEAVARIDKLIDGRNYVAAVREIRAAPEEFPRRDVLLERAQTEIDKATELYLRARRPDTPNARRAELYAAALDLCADLSAARNELDRIPPNPPGRARATVTDPAAGVRLTWPASPDLDIAYVVVRVTGDRVPERPDETSGPARLGRTTTTGFRDAAAAGLPGVPLRYAVFTERSGTYSTPVVTAPVVITAEATVETDTDDGEVTVTWHVPDTAVRVEVSRAEVGAEHDAPVVLATTVPGRVTDTDVRNGGRYRYTVRVAYPGPAGGLVWSSGRSREVTPAGRPAPPGPLTAVRISTELSLAEHTTQLRWPPPGQGVVKVVRVRGTGALREGDRVTEADLFHAGRVLDGPSPVNDAWIDKGLVLCTYLPVVILNGTGHVGKPRHYARLPEPTGIHVEYVGTAVRVGWTWPEDGTRVLVGCELSDQAPVDPTVAARQVLVGRHPGDRFGGCEIPAGSSTHVSVVLASAVDHEGLPFVGSGVPAHAVRPTTHIGYEVRTGARRRLDLVLRADTPVDLPALTLRGHPDRQPHTADDGEAVTTLPPSRLVDTHAVHLPKTARPDFRYRLFPTTAPSSVRLDPL
ncbi:zinc ribbon domain-containing protein [Actinosynnema sp. NPDC049800]